MVVGEEGNEFSETSFWYDGRVGASVKPRRTSAHSEAATILCLMLPPCAGVNRICLESLIYHIVSNG